MGRLLFLYMDIEDKDYPFLNKSVVRLAAKNSAGEDVYLEVDESDKLKVTTDGSTNIDAFYRLRVSEPQTLFDSKQIYDNQPLFWDDQQISGSGTSSTYNTNQASTTIGVSANTAGVRVRQTFRHFNYQPGKSQLVILTAVLGTASETGIIKRLGQFNTNNGLFFQLDSTGLAVVVRTFATGSVVNNAVYQSAWNIDKLDGTGASGITLDTTKTLIYFLDYEWLGVGTIRFGFFVNGKPYYCHAVHNSNINTVVYMSLPNLPLRYEITNTGTGAASNMTHICTTVITEGGRQQTGIERAINRGIDTLTTLNDADIYPLIGLRLKATQLGVFVRLLDYQVICTSTAEYAYYIMLNPTIAGTALTWVDITNSGLQYSYGTSATKISGGTVIATGIGSDTVQSRSGISRVTESDLAIGSNIAGTPDQIFIGIQRLTGTTETFYGSVIWSETT